MKRIMLAGVILCGQVGCGSRSPTREEAAITASRRLIVALETNASVRIIRRSAGIREKLKDVGKREDRERLIDDWRKALENIPVDRLRPSDRYWSVREAHHELDSNLIGAMWDNGTSYETRWRVRLDAIKWLGRQADLMRPKKVARIGSRRDEDEKWANYQALMEYREVAVENIELNAFDESRYPNDVEKMRTLRAEFEKLIGRPVRRSEDVKGLGFYRRQVSARVQAERAAASEKSSR